MRDNDAQDGAEEPMDARAGAEPPGSVLFPFPHRDARDSAPCSWRERRACRWASKASCLPCRVLPYSRKNREHSQGTSASISSSLSIQTGPGMPSATSQCLKLESLPEMFSSELNNFPRPGYSFFFIEDNTYLRRLPWESIYYTKVVWYMLCALSNFDSILFGIK